MCRAVLESIAYEVGDLVDTMAMESRTPMAELRVDGGASVSDFMMQFQSDLLEIPVIRPQMVETTAAGAAFLAGLATGIGKALREMFLSFFETKGHLRLPSFSLIPQNDPSLLLINSGMAPMKPFFTGDQEPPPSPCYHLPEVHPHRRHREHRPHRPSRHLF